MNQSFVKLQHMMAQTVQPPPRGEPEDPIPGTSRSKSRGKVLNEFDDTSEVTIYQTAVLPKRISSSSDKPVNTNDEFLFDTSPPADVFNMGMLAQPFDKMQPVVDVSGARDGSRDTRRGDSHDREQRYRTESRDCDRNRHEHGQQRDGEKMTLTERGDLLGGKLIREPKHSSNKPKLQRQKSMKYQVGWQYIVIGTK